jgi:hypothetical protein
MLRKTCVLHLVGYAGHLVHCVASGTQNVDALYFMLRWNRYSFHKIHDGTRYTKLVFLHLVGSTGYVVHCVAPGARNIDALFFMLGWYRYGFHKKPCWDTLRKLVSLHPMVSPGHVVHCDAFGVQNVDALSTCSGGMSTDSTKSVMGHIKMSLCFCIRWDLWVT